MPVFLLEYEDFMDTKIHRHFVALPLTILLMLAVAGFQSVLPVGAADVSGAPTVRFKTDATPLDFQVGWILSGMLERDVALRVDESGEHTELLKGQALIKSTGLTELSMGKLKVHALAASYAALHGDTSSTVVPLTAPVIVTSGEDIAVVVPGMQISINSLGKMTSSTVPPDWYAERLEALKLLPEIVIPPADESNAQVQLAHFLADGGRITAVALSSAEATARLLDPSGVVSELLFLRLLQEAQWTDEDASRVLADNISQDRFLASELVPTLPLLVATLLKPVSDRQIQVWEKSALSLGITDSAAIISVFHRFSGFPQGLARAGYPRQSLLWQHAFYSVGTILGTTLSGKQRTDLEADLAIITRGDNVDAHIENTVQSMPGPTTHWSEAELTAIVFEILLSRGVLIASTLQLASDTPTQTVRVTGVFIAEQGTDTAYAFTVDVSRKLITDIIRDGKKLPNAVPTDVFFD